MEPTAWAVVVDGTVTLTAPPPDVPAPITDAFLTAARKRGFYPVTGESPDHDHDAGRLVFDGYSLMGDHVEAVYHVEPHPEPDAAVLPTWYAGLVERDNQIEKLFTDFRDRFDAGLAVVEEAAEYVATLDFDDKLGQIDRILDRVKDALKG